MVKQSDRQSVKVLLKENDRFELRRFINKVWTEEDTPELCFDKLLKLYPEKKIYGPITIPDYGTDEEDWDKYYQD
tara:strand:+ start:3556 stop:3780 length:225 start_codon:yes stop_codon:yes gene_type:complete